MVSAEPFKDGVDKSCRDISRRLHHLLHHMKSHDSPFNAVGHFGTVAGTVTICDRAPEQKNQPFQTFALQELPLITATEQGPCSKIKSSISNYWNRFLMSNCEAPPLLFIWGRLMFLSRTWLPLLLEKCWKSQVCGTLACCTGSKGFVLDGNQQRGLCNTRLSSPCLHGEAERQSRSKISQRNVCSNSSSNKWQKKPEAYTPCVCQSVPETRRWSYEARVTFQGLVDDTGPKRYNDTLLCFE